MVKQNCVWTVASEHGGRAESVHSSWESVCLRYPGAAATHGTDPGVTAVGDGFYFESVDSKADRYGQTHATSWVAEYFLVENWSL